MTQMLRQEIETCGCQICRSDLAYIIPCLKEIEDGPDGGTASVEEAKPAVVEIFPLPLVM